MQSQVVVSPDNPYGEVHIPRAHLRSNDSSTVIANPAVVSTDGNPYATSSSAPPPPYMVKEDREGEEEGGRRGACCYRCRRKK